MLISCPECDRQVSERAVACPQCGFPIAEEVAKQTAKIHLEQTRASRKEVGEVDCVVCEARGFCTTRFNNDQGIEPEGFTWCSICEHTGRVVLCEASDGFFAVAQIKLSNFLHGEIDADGKQIFTLGPIRPQGHRYPQSGARIKADK